MTTMTVPEAARRLGKSPSTIRYWVDALGYKEKDANGHRVISPDLFNTLHFVREQVDQGRNMEEIRAMLPEPPSQTELVAHVPETQSTAQLTPVLHQLAETFETMVDTIKNNQAVTLALTETAMENGRLKADNQHLQKELAKSAELVAQLQQQLDKTNQRIKELEHAKRPLIKWS